MVPACAPFEDLPPVLRMSDTKRTAAVALRRLYAGVAPRRQRCNLRGRQLSCPSGDRTIWRQGCSFMLLPSQDDVLIRSRGVCDVYCASFGHKCVAAAEEKAETCEVLDPNVHCFADGARERGLARAM